MSYPNLTASVIVISQTSGSSIGGQYPFIERQISGSNLFIITDSSGKLTGSSVISNLNVTNAITASVVSASFTGSHFGTSSWSNNATTSSYAYTSSIALNSLTASYVTSSNVVGTVNSASYANSSSYASQSTNAATASSINFTASNATNAQTSSYLPVATYSITSSWANNSINSLTASSINFIPATSSYASSASYAPTNITTSWAQSSSNAVNSQTASVANALNTSNNYTINNLTASNISASGTIIASSFTGSHYGTSSWANNATSASYAPPQIITGSTLPVTASVAIVSLTSSYLPVNTYNITSSWSNYSLTASYITSSNVIGTVASASYAISTSYAPTNVTTSWAQNANIAINSLTASSLNLTGSIRLTSTNDPDINGTDANSTYLFVSASNNLLGNDFYIRQDGNLVKWKWMEGLLQTGLLYGGVLSYSGTTVYISSGSGIILNYNASTGSETSPIVKYVNWPNQSINLGSRVTSSQATYVLIDSYGVAQSQDDTFFTNDQYAQSIPLGMVNHTGRDVITSVANNTYTAYNTTNQTFDFIEAFGPLKVNGLTVTGQSGTLRLNVGPGDSFILGGFYQQDPNDISHKSTNAYLTASIARVWRSGSGQFKTDNNSGSFYTTIDPTKYDPTGDGTLSTVGNNWSIQRVFFNPFTGRVHVYYGQNIYDKLDTAIANLSSDSFNEALYTAHQYVFTAYLILNGQGSNTDLTNTTNNKIIQSGLFRNTVGSSGTTTFTNRLQNLSDISIVNPINGQALIYDSGLWINGRPSSASNAINAETASFLPVNTYNITSSWANNSISASYVNSLNQNIILTGSIYITGSGITTTGSINITQGKFNVDGVDVLDTALVYAIALG